MRCTTDAVTSPSPHTPSHLRQEPTFSHHTFRWDKQICGTAVYKKIFLKSPPFVRLEAVCSWTILLPILNPYQPPSPSPVPSLAEKLVPGRPRALLRPGAGEKGAGDYGFSFVAQLCIARVRAFTQNE
eukprot:scaffold75200_cov28-Tisochrysis_lutea.AAC.1